MLQQLVKEGYTYLVSSLYIVRLQCVRVGGYYVNIVTYPLQEVDAEEGGGRLIHGEHLIRTLR